ncbi:MAG: hypothetical protein EA361_15755 [Bacteroidetes bacterium]|nr:MAG: hypothetical protein EA361_15755 [Bacteroidota bacterium]
MNLLIVSDLHIGNNDCFSTFGWKAEEFMNALQRVKYEEQIDKIILNGDVFELYKYAFDEICDTNSSLVDYLLHNPDVIYLKGNHDALCPFGSDSVSFENSNGKSIYIEHGHAADFMNGKLLGQRVQTFGFNLLRWGIQMDWIFKAYRKIFEMHEAINKIPKKYDSIKYLTHALRLLKSHDVVLLGHTHKIEAHKTYYLNNKKTYINSGSCSLGRFQGVVLNTESLKHETLKFKSYSDLMSHYDKDKVLDLAMSA